jgi:hypothetical protein
MHLGFIHHNRWRTSAMNMHTATNTETAEIAPTTPGLKRLESLEAPLRLVCVAFIVTVNVGDPGLTVAEVAFAYSLWRISRVGMVVIVKA